MKLMVIAIMTLYHPGNDIVENLLSIINQVDLLFLCDNGDVPSFERFGNLNKTKYLFMNRNCGISMAFNVVLKSHNFSADDFVVFFDQDSAVSRGHLNCLLNEYKRLSKNLSIGCLGPAYYDRNVKRVDFPKKKEIIDEYNISVSTIITSSMICMYKDLCEIGFWNEKIFLDYSDWDLCWRMKKMGKMIVVCKKTLLNHAVGEGEKRVGVSVKLQNPIRNYYQTRDGLRLLTESYVPIRYRFFFIESLMMTSILQVIICKERWKRVKYIVKGWIDYFLDYHGECQ